MVDQFEQAILGILKFRREISTAAKNAGRSRRTGAVKERAGLTPAPGEAVRDTTQGNGSSGSPPDLSHHGSLCPLNP